MKLNEIQIDWTINPRIRDDALIKKYENLIRGYGENWQAGCWGERPRVTEDGWLYSGFHTVSACLEIFEEDETILVEVQGDGHRAAKLLACGQNAHGKSRSNEEKRRAINTLLDDEKWSKWSNRLIAKQCRVDEKTVRTVKAERAAAETRSETDTDERTYITKHGTEATMNTKNIGAATKTPPEPSFTNTEEPYDEEELAEAGLSEKMPNPSMESITDRMTVQYMAQTVRELITEIGFIADNETPLANHLEETHEILESAMDEGEEYLAELKLSVTHGKDTHHTSFYVDNDKFGILTSVTEKENHDN